VSDVTERAKSIGEAVAKLRGELPASEWRAAQVLALVGELAAVAELLDRGVEDQPAAPAKRDRTNEVGRLVYLAVRALPEGLEGPARDREVCRIGRQWGLLEAELAAEGYRT
jgi:hypothetical protein